MRTLMHLRVFALAFAMAFVCLPGFAQTKTKLVVYSTLEADHIDSYRKAFEADHPDIEIALIRDSVGVITARLLAEKERPQGDAIWGLAITSMALLDAQNMLEPFAPRELARIKPNFRDAQNPPHWVGIDAWVEIGRAHV